MSSVAQVLEPRTPDNSELPGPLLAFRTPLRSILSTDHLLLKLELLGLTDCGLLHPALSSRSPPQAQCGSQVGLRQSPPSQSKGCQACCFQPGLLGPGGGPRSLGSEERARPARAPEYPSRLTPNSIAMEERCSCSWLWLLSWAAATGVWHRPGRHTPSSCGLRGRALLASRGSPSRPWKQRVNRLGKEGAAVLWLRSLVN